MRSRNVSPGLAVMRTTISSLSTRVPPVTAERSPPDSRITGADSPVIADSSTVAMPSTIVAVAGDHLAGGDDAQVAELRAATTASRRSIRRRGRTRAVVSARVLRSVVGLGLAAALGHRLGEVGEQHREPQPRGDEPGEHVLLCVAARPKSRMNSTVVSTEPTSTMNITGLRIIVRGLSFLNGVERRRRDDRRIEDRLRRRLLAAHLRRALGSGSGCCVATLQSSVSRPQIDRCSRIGPSASAGKNVRPATMTTTPTTSTPNSGVCVGIVPLVAGTFGLAASEPPIASAGMIRKNRPDQHRDALGDRVPLRCRCPGRRTPSRCCWPPRRSCRAPRTGRGRPAGTSPPIFEHHRRRGERQQRERHRQDVQRHQLHLGRLDLLAEVLRRSPDHQPGDEHRQQGEDRACPSGRRRRRPGDLAEHHVQHRRPSRRAA